MCLQTLSGRDPGINKWGFRPTVFYWIHSEILNEPKPDSCGITTNVTSTPTLLYTSAVKWSQSTVIHQQVCRLTVVTRLWAARPRNRGSIPCRSKRLISSPKGSRGQRHLTSWQSWYFPSLSIDFPPSIELEGSWRGHRECAPNQTIQPTRSQVWDHG